MNDDELLKTNKFLWGEVMSRKVGVFISVFSANNEQVNADKVMRRFIFLSPACTS